MAGEVSKPTAGFRYRAFVSYSRQDRPHAKRLQAALESYVLPASLRTISAGARLNTRPIKPVFRDEDELVPGQDLPARIRAGLQGSEFLVVVCSPQAVASEWVEKEICDFVRMGRRHNILVVVVDGEPNSPDPPREALPRALRHFVDDNGVITDTPAEPLWIDWRVGAPRSDRTMFLRIVAALLSLESLDSLIQRDARARRWKRIVAWSATGAAIMVLLLAGFLLTGAERQRLAERSVVLTQLANKAIESHYFDRALRLSIVAMHGSDDWIFGFDEPPALRAATANLLANHPYLAMSHLEQEGSVRLVAYSPDGQFALSATRDAARFWETSTGKQRGPDIDLQSEDPSAAFSPDGNLAVVCSDRAQATVIGLSDFKPIWTEPPAGEVAAICKFSPDGKQLATASGSDDEKFQIQFWNTSDWTKAEPTLATEDLVDQLEFSPDQKLVVAASYGRVDVWDSKTGKPIFAPIILDSDGSDEVTHLEFSADGTLLLVETEDYVRLFSASTGNVVDDVISREDGIAAARFMPDGKSLIIATPDGNLETWSIASWKQIEVAKIGEAIGSIAFSRDGKLLLAGVETGVTILPLEPDSRAPTLLREEEGGLSEAISPDGKMVLAGSSDGIGLWRLAEGAPSFGDLQHQNDVRQVRFSADGKMAVTASADHSARVWNVATGNPLTPPLKHDLELNDARFSADGRLIVTAASDNTARIWDVATGQMIMPPLKHGVAVRSAEFSADGRYVLTATDFEAQIWDVSSRREATLVLKLGSRDELGLSFVSFSLDGSRVLTLSQKGYAQIWDAATGAQVGETLTDEAEILSARFSPDGALIVTTSLDGSTRLWDPSTGTRIGETFVASGGFLDAVISPDNERLLVFGNGELHLWEVSSHHELFASKSRSRIDWAAFSSDNRMFATLESNGAYVWDADTGRSIGPPLTTGYRMMAASFSRNGKALAVAGEGNLARIWDIDAISLSDQNIVQIACDRLHRAGLSIFTEEDRSEAPTLQADDFGIEGDVCLMTNPWSKFLGALVGG